MATKRTARGAEPKQVFTFTTSDGRQRTLKADEQGVVKAQNAEDEQALRYSFGLKVESADDEVTQERGRKQKKQAAEPLREQTTTADALHASDEREAEKADAGKEDADGRG